MAYIGKQPVVGNFQKCDAISVVNGQAAYSLTVGSAAVSPENANHMLVSLNGVLQAPGDSFTVSGSTLTFASNLATGDVIDFVIILGDVLDLGTPSDGTVTAAKVANDLISGKTALASEPADTDEFLVSDAGTLKRIDYSLIKASSPGLTHIKTITASDSSSIDFNNGSSGVTLDNTFNRYIFYIDIQMATDNTQLQLLYSTNAGTSYLDQNYQYAMIGRHTAGSTQGRNNANDSQIELFPDTIGAQTDEMFGLTLSLSNLDFTDTHKAAFWHGGGYTADGNLCGYSGGGTNYSSTDAVTGVRFKSSSGNLERGTIALFGVSTS